MSVFAWSFNTIVSTYIDCIDQHIPKLYRRSEQRVSQSRSSLLTPKVKASGDESSRDASRPHLIFML